MMRKRPANWPPVPLLLWKVFVEAFRWTVPIILAILAPWPWKMLVFVYFVVMAPISAVRLATYMRMFRSGWPSSP